MSRQGTMACSAGSVVGCGVPASMLMGVLAWGSIVNSGAVASISTVAPAVGEVGGTGGENSCEEARRRELARMPSMSSRPCSGECGLLADGDSGWDGGDGCEGGV